jgi:hypothetical protein
MGHIHVACLLLSASLGQPAPPSDEYYAAVGAAGTELRNQLDFFRRSLVNVPNQELGRGLYKQTTRAFLDLTYFREQVVRKASKDTLYLAFSEVDTELNQLLDDVSDLEKWTPALRMAARRTHAALHDLQFAMSTGESSPAKLAQVETRQLQTLLHRETDLEALVGIVLYQNYALKDWTEDFAVLKRNIAELRRLQKSNPTRDDLKEQFRQTDAAWEKLVSRFKMLPTDLTLQLREDFGQVDQVFSRISQQLGIDRRAPLQTNFLR